jgi:5-hydroxyisourate hydrolase
MITTHVLDTARGGAAAGVRVVLDRRSGDGWERLASAATDANGRIGDLTEGLAIAPGTYRLTFDTGAYHRAMGVGAFFPEAQVTFEIRHAGEHCHVPLLLSPFGYSTYRGT